MNRIKRSFIIFVLMITVIPSFSSAATIAELQAQLTALMAQVAALQSQQATPAAPQSGATPSVSCPNLSRNLSRGMRGSDVTQLQQFLISQNLLAADSATGFFGAMTESAVKQWQAKNGIASSGTPATTGYGVVGPKTRSVIVTVCASSRTPAMPGVPVTPTASGVPPAPTVPTYPPAPKSSIPLAVPALPLSPPLLPQTATVHYPQLWFDAKQSKDVQGNSIVYAYAPVIFKENNTYHLYACTQSTSPSRGWDTIRHTQSQDGNTWSTTEIVLIPALIANNNTTDRSACDPSIVKFDAHDGAGLQYYLFYTGAGMNIGGAVYVARAPTPSGPFLKYTSRGTWESDPLDPMPLVKPQHALSEAIIANPLARPGYGAGEQSVLVKGGTLYMWYSDDTTAFPGYVGFRTFVATSTDAVHWSKPVMTDLGLDYTIESIDVKYDVLSESFLLFDTPNKSSAIVYLERHRSIDGIHWSRIDNICTTVECFPQFANNIGVGGDNQGHLLSDKTIIGFGSPYLNSTGECDGTATCILETVSGITIEGYAGAVSISRAAATRPLYQFVMNTPPFNGKYFFLTRKFMEGVNAGYSFVGQAFNVYTNPGNGLVAVYRCLNNSDHFMSRDAQCEGHTNEGHEGYLRETPAAGHAPVFRMYSAEMGDHLITLDLAQGTSKGYVSEGILGFAPLN